MLVLVLNVNYNLRFLIDFFILEELVKVIKVFLFLE